MTTYLPPRAQLSAGLLVASRQWQRLADQAFGEFGLSSACTGPLLMIGRSGGGIRQVALAQQLGMKVLRWFGCWTSCARRRWCAAKPTAATAVPTSCG